MKGSYLEKQDLSRRGLQSESIRGATTTAAVTATTTTTEVVRATGSRRNCGRAMVLFLPQCPRSTKYN